MRWSREKKEAWRDNISYVMAYQDQRRLELDTRTPEGVYNATLALTGDPEQARHAKTEREIQVKRARLAAGVPELE